MKFAMLFTITHEPCVTFVNLSHTTTPNSLLLQWYPLDWTIVIQFFTRRCSLILQNFIVFKTSSPASLPEHDNVIVSHRFLLTSTGCHSLHALNTRSLCWPSRHSHTSSQVIYMSYFASTCQSGRSGQQNRSIAFKSTVCELIHCNLNLLQVVPSPDAHYESASWNQDWCEMGP
jgi:hypothetical protein